MLNDIFYVYDELARLKAVVDAGEDTAVFSYDGTGNLLSIERGSSSAISVITFAPQSAAVGESIIIYGTGFSATASENTVQFNGIPAAVISATSTEIVASVPSGASTGPVSVAVPAGTAVSDVPFTVVAAPEAPTISGLSPPIGAAGTAATINGTGFDSTPDNNNVMFNRTLALLTSASASAVGVEVPPGAGSGRIRISTPTGNGISAEDFFIPPSTHTVEDVAVTSRITLGQSEAVDIGAPDKIALLVFDGSPGQRLSIGVSEIDSGTDSGPIEVSVRNPYGIKLTDKLVGRSGDDLELDPLRDAGTYTIVVDPGTLTVSLVLTLSEPVLDNITLDGAPLTVNIASPGQNARVAFTATAGQRVDLDVGSVQFDSGFGVVDLTILRPNGEALASALVGTSGRGVHTDLLPDSGTYTIVVQPANAKTVSLVLTLSRPISAALTIDGPATPITLRPGQTARLSFDGAAGSRVNLGVTEVSFGSGSHMVLSILKPDGSDLVSRTVSSIGGDIDSDELTDAGSYTVVVIPGGSPFVPQSTDASMMLILSEPVTGTLSVDGPASSVALQRPGQDARLTFEGTVGQAVRLTVSDVSFDLPGVVSGGDVSILRPDGTILSSTTIVVGGSDIDISALPDMGSYTALVSPGVLTVSVTLALSTPN